MSSYKDLTVWEKSMDLTEEIYKLVKTFPKEEIYALSNQMRRAAVSIPSNIAEGSSRQSTKEFIQFIYIACGSLSELETQLLLSRRLNYVDDEKFNYIISLCDEVGRMLNGLKCVLNSKLKR